MLQDRQIGADRLSPMRLSFAFLLALVLAGCSSPPQGGRVGLPDPTTGPVSPGWAAPRATHDTSSAAPLPEPLLADTPRAGLVDGRATFEAPLGELRVVRWILTPEMWGEALLWGGEAGIAWELVVEAADGSGREVLGGTLEVRRDGTEPVLAGLIGFDADPGIGDSTAHAMRTDPIAAAGSWSNAGPFMPAGSYDGPGVGRWRHEVPLPEGRYDENAARSTSGTSFISRVLQAVPPWRGIVAGDLRARRHVGRVRHGAAFPAGNVGLHGSRPGGGLRLVDAAPRRRRRFSRSSWGGAEDRSATS